MVDIPAAAAWKIEFSDQSASALAASVVESFGRHEIHVGPPAFLPPERGTYGTAEIIISVLAATLTKATIIWGLDAIERAIEAAIGKHHEENIRIVVHTATGRRKSFPLSLRDLNREVVKQFFEEVKGSVEHM